MIVGKGDIANILPDREGFIFFASGVSNSQEKRLSEYKKEQEKLIKEWFEHYTIVRVGNINWGNNPHTLINYFKNAMKNGDLYHVESVYRHIIDKEEFLYWMELIPEWNCEMNIPGEKVWVPDLVKELEEIWKL